MSIPEHVLTTRTRLAGLEIECGETANLLQSASTALSGSEAIGYEAMEAAFRQMSKVIRNYMRVVDREIEDRDPGAIHAIYEALEAAKTKLDERPETPEAPAYSPPPPEIADLINILDTPEHTDEKLLQKLIVAQHASERAREDGEHEGKGLKHWLDHIERVRTGIKWNTGRMVEIVG